jgi:hypothetical protein
MSTPQTVLVHVLHPARQPDTRGATLAEPGVATHVPARVLVVLVPGATSTPSRL